MNVNDLGRPERALVNANLGCNLYKSAVFDVRLMRRLVFFWSLSLQSICSMRVNCRIRELYAMLAKVQSRIIKLVIKELFCLMLQICNQLCR